MTNRRGWVLLSAPALLAGLGLGLTSCSGPAPAFDLVTGVPVASQANPGEQQLFAGSYTFQAAPTGTLTDLRWHVTYGPQADPAATPVSSSVGAELTAAFEAPTDLTKRVYRVCLSSDAQPLNRSCQDFAVGAEGRFGGVWTSSPADPLANLVGNQTGRDVTVTIVMPRGTPTVGRGQMSSPFLFTFTDGGRAVWVEWISSTQLEVGNLYPDGYPNPSTFNAVIPPA